LAPGIIADVAAIMLGEAEPETGHACYTTRPAEPERDLG